MQKELTLLERWNAPTSPFFKPLVKPCFILAVVCAAVVGITQNLSTSLVSVPEVVNQISAVASAILATIGTLSKLTVDFEKLPEYLAELQKQKALKDL